MELAFTDREAIMDLIEGLICLLWKDIRGTVLERPFLKMDYHTAMSFYGSDKPDLRKEWTIQDGAHWIPDWKVAPGNVLDLLHIKGSEAAYIMSDKPGSEGAENCLAQALTQIYEESFPHYGHKVKPGDLKVGYFKNQSDLEPGVTISEEWTKALLLQGKFEQGDLIIAHERRVELRGGHTVLGRLRALLIKNFPKPMPSEKFLWVHSFPLFTPDESWSPSVSSVERYSSTHHPFTAPLEEDRAGLFLGRVHPLHVRGQNYDLVFNGTELGGGSIRIHSPSEQSQIFSRFLGLSEDKIHKDFGHLLEALGSGCPPHGGLALGLDRLVAWLCRTTKIRDVMAFPKLSGTDPLVQCPNQVDERQLKEYHLHVLEKKS